MRIIETLPLLKQDRPAKLNKAVEKIIVNYAFFDFNNDNEESRKIPLLVSKKNLQEGGDVDLATGLALLKQFRYIEDFTEVIQLQNHSYKEKSWAILRLNSQIRTLPNHEEKTVPYVIYVGNSSKWNFLKKLRTDPTEKEEDLSSEETKGKIEKFVRLYTEKDWRIKHMIRNLSTDYPLYFPEKANVDEDSFKDFLLFFAYKFRSEFDALRIQDQPGFDRNNYTHLDLIRWRIVDNFWNEALELTKTEHTLIKALIRKAKDGDGIHEESLRWYTEQPTKKALEQTLKVLRRRLKDLGIDKDIEITHYRADDTYRIKWQMGGKK